MEFSLDLVTTIEVKEDLYDDLFSNALIVVGSSIQNIGLRFRGCMDLLPGMKAFCITTRDGKFISSHKTYEQALFTFKSMSRCSF
jgi:hypothetical protein